MRHQKRKNKKTDQQFCRSSNSPRAQGSRRLETMSARNFWMDATLQLCMKCKNTALMSVSKTKWNNSLVLVHAWSPTKELFFLHVLERCSLWNQQLNGWQSSQSQTRSFCSAMLTTSSSMARLNSFDGFLEFHQSKSILR